MSTYTGSTIDHLNITATDLVGSRAFYDEVLSVIGVEKLLDFPTEGGRPAMIGYGQHPKPFFWLVDGPTVDPNLHLAFTVESREAVDAFYAAAVDAGATVREEPAVHPEYHPTITGRLSTILTGSTSKPSATRRRDRVGPVAPTTGETDALRP